MGDTMERVARFLRRQSYQATVGPSVTVDYHSWSYDPDGAQVRLRAGWEILCPELEAAGAVKSAKWNDYGGGYKFQELLVEIDGVVIKLSGPHYPSERSRSEVPQPTTPQERADSFITQFSGQHAVTVLADASRTKLILLRDLVNHALGERSADPEVVSATVEKVLQVLQVRSLVQPPTGGD